MAHAEEPWLVVGLGNPGPLYAGNRHNVGAMVIQELGSRHDLGSAVASHLGARHGGSFKAHRSQALVDEVRLQPSVGPSPGPKVVLAIPTTYMNESGGSVSALLRFYSVDLDHFIVVHDELDIPAGGVRLKRGGGEGGHNGLRSITKALRSKDFYRVRVGIGRPPGRMDPADFVLRDFTSMEKAELSLTIELACDAVESLVAVGLLASQQRFHAPID